MRGFSPCDQATRGTLIRPPATFSRKEKDGFRDSPASRRRIAKSPLIPSPPGRRCRGAADEGLFTLRSGHTGTLIRPPATFSREEKDGFPIPRLLAAGLQSHPLTLLPLGEGAAERRMRGFSPCDQATREPSSGLRPPSPGRRRTDFTIRLLRAAGLQSHP